MKLKRFSLSLRKWRLDIRLVPINRFYNIMSPFTNEPIGKAYGSPDDDGTIIIDGDDILLHDKCRLEEISEKEFHKDEDE